MLNLLLQLGPLPSPSLPPEVVRLEFAFWAQACLCLFSLVAVAACVFVLLFRYSDRFRERCARYVEQHGTPLGDQSKGGA